MSLSSGEEIGRPVHTWARFSFSMLPSPTPLTGAEMEALSKENPFIYGLLAEPGLTTPIIAAKTGAHEQLASRQCFETDTASGHLLRKTMLYCGEKIFELAEVRFSSPAPEWAKSTFALGPWLRDNGFTFHKEMVTPLCFEYIPTLKNIFQAGEHRSCFGRFYLWKIRSPSSEAWDLPVRELWCPEYKPTQETAPKFI